jgi:hypothetical protein
VAEFWLNPRGSVLAGSVTAAAGHPYHIARSIPRRFRGASRQMPAELRVAIHVLIMRNSIFAYPAIDAASP